MLALSTSWNADGRFTARGFCAAVRSLGLAAIELSYRCIPAEIREFGECCRETGLRVASVHNFCPVPEESPPGRARSEALLLSSPDGAERRRAVEATRRSIATAASLGARALIVHLGRVEGPAGTRELIRLYREGRRGDPRYRSAKEALETRRARRARPHFENAVRSIEELAGELTASGVILAVENRYYYGEIPSCAEVRSIREAFAGGPVGYWHDIGHAQVMENLGFGRHEDYLDAAGDMLCGFHIHDVLLCRDHLPPGQGMVDFSRFAGRMARGAMNVIELGPAHGMEDVGRGVGFLKDLLGDIGGPAARQSG